MRQTARTGTTDVHVRCVSCGNGRGRPLSQYVSQGHFLSPFANNKAAPLSERRSVFSLSRISREACVCYSQFCGTGS